MPLPPPSLATQNQLKLNKNSLAFTFIISFIHLMHCQGQPILSWCLLNDAAAVTLPQRDAL